MDNKGAEMKYLDHKDYTPYLYEPEFHRCDKCDKQMTLSDICWMNGDEMAAVCTGCLLGIVAREFRVFQRYSYSEPYEVEFCEQCKEVIEPGEEVYADRDWPLFCSSDCVSLYCGERNFGNVLKRGVATLSGSDWLKYQMENTIYRGSDEGVVQSPGEWMVKRFAISDQERIRQAVSGFRQIMGGAA